MAGTHFQYIFDKAESISISKDPVVAQTQSRDQTVKSVKRTDGRWRFEVTLPNGMPWTEVRPYLEGIDLMGMYRSGTVQINNAGYNAWFTAYMGDSANSTGFVASATLANANIILTSSPTTTSGYKFKAGDIIQLGTGGNVYTVTTNVAYNENLVQLNRPVRDSSGSKDLKVGPNVTWNVICTSKPTWTVFARNQVSWSGPFIFYETLQE